MHNMMAYAEFFRNLRYRINSNVLFDSVCLILIIFEFFTGLLIIKKVSYTEYDWKSYMQFSEYYYNGERNFTVYVGGTGPLVYPAGHVYIFNWLYNITSKGVNIPLAQHIFHIIYMIMMSSVMRIYRKSHLLDRVFMILWMCTTSYRVHALFMLRLHNDCIATLLIYMSIYCILINKWTIGCILYSLATSIKMNILLFAPGLLLLLLTKFNLKYAIAHILLCGIIQVVIAMEFLTTYPIDYIKCSFELTRQFKYYSGISNRFMSEELFASRFLHLTLLIFHLYFLYLAYHKCVGMIFLNNYNKNKLKSYEESTNTIIETSIQNCDNSFLSMVYKSQCKLTNDNIIYIFFLSNFIGIVFSRSIHYNFYLWYYHTLPYLVWNTNIPFILKFVLLSMIEYCYNVYPANAFSSCILNILHFLLLGAIFWKNSMDYKIHYKNY